MVENPNLQGVPRLEEPVGYVKLNADEGAFTVIADAVAYDVRDRNQLLALSMAGGTTEVRAFRAAFATEAKVTFEWNRPGEYRQRLTKDADGYEVYTAPLGLGTFHLVALAKRPGFLQSADEESIWQFLAETTTTPLDRAWLPAIKERLVKDERLTVPSAHGRINPAVLRADTDLIDKYVREGLRHGALKIVA